MKCPACGPPGRPGSGPHTCGIVVAIHTPVSGELVMSLLREAPPGYRLLLQHLPESLCGVTLVKDQGKENTTDAID